MESEGCNQRPTYVNDFLQDLCQGYHNQAVFWKEQKAQKTKRKQTAVRMQRRGNVVGWMKMQCSCCVTKGGEQDSLSKGLFKSALNMKQKFIQIA